MMHAYVGRFFSLTVFFVTGGNFSYIFFIKSTIANQCEQHKYKCNIDIPAIYIFVRFLKQ